MVVARHQPAERDQVGVTAALGDAGGRDLLGRAVALGRRDVQHQARVRGSRLVEGPVDRLRPRSRTPRTPPGACRPGSRSAQPTPRRRLCTPNPRREAASWPARRRARCCALRARPAASPGSGAALPLDTARLDATATAAARDARRGMRMLLWESDRVRRAVRARRRVDERPSGSSPAAPSRRTASMRPARPRRPSRPATTTAQAIRERTAPATTAKRDEPGASRGRVRAPVPAARSTACWRA